jgi:hypothetical protein
VLPRPLQIRIGAIECHVGFRRGAFTQKPFRLLGVEASVVAEVLAINPAGSAGHAGEIRPIQARFPEEILGVSILSRVELQRTKVIIKSCVEMDRVGECVLSG